MREQILQEIRRLSKANDDQAPGVQRFERETGIRATAWRGIYWARWSDALIEAGFTPNDFQGKHETAHIFQKFVEACRHFSRIPTVDELKMFARTQVNFPNPKSVYSHFGSKSALIENLREWVKDRATFEDVAAMLGASSEKNEARSAQREGLVYLIKAGPHYKIGRSDELERRVADEMFVAVSWRPRSANTRSHFAATTFRRTLASLYISVRRLSLISRRPPNIATRSTGTRRR